MRSIFALLKSVARYSAGLCFCDGLPWHATISRGNKMQSNVHVTKAEGNSA